MKKKISLILPSLRGGGAERMLLNLSNEFSKQNLDVDLVLVQKEGPYLNKVSENVNIVDLKSKRVLFSLLPLYRYLKEQKPDVLLSSMEHMNIIAILAKMFSCSNTKVIARVANTLSVSLQGTKFYKRWLRLYGAMFFYRFADVVMANSKGSADDLANTLHIKRSEIKVIYNPTITPDIFEKAKEKFDHKWLKDEKIFVILGVGRFHIQKDFPTLIKAFSLLRERTNKNIYLIILGEGEERKKLEKLVEELSLQEYVDMPGFVNNPYSYMADSDVYVLSSKWEGLPNTLIEALACGASVVSTDCKSGPSEILEDGKYGELVPVGDIEALSKSIEKILDNPMDSSKLIERAKEFSVEKQAKEYLKLIF